MIESICMEATHRQIEGKQKLIETMKDDRKPHTNNNNK